MVAELPAQNLGLLGISSLPGVLSHESSMKLSLTPTEGGVSFLSSCSEVPPTQGEVPPPLDPQAQEGPP